MNDLSAQSRTIYLSIYSAQNQNSQQVLAALQQVMAQDQVLKAYV